jgi:hypothetical protein
MRLQSRRWRDVLPMRRNDVLPRSPEWPLTRCRCSLQLSCLGLMFAGITIRWMAIHALGVFFTGRVQIREGHTLIRTGLYSRLRHPACAGSLRAYFGLGLAFSNGWTLACSLLPYLVAIGYRIHIEEAVLQETFGPAYAQYARTTKRHVPIKKVYGWAAAASAIDCPSAEGVGESEPGARTRLRPGPERRQHNPEAQRQRHSRPARFAR